MNEKIRQLARQSGATDVDGTTPTTLFCFTGKELERFVELIVEECVSVGYKAFLNDHSKVPVFPSEQMKKHFGVEE